MEYRFIRPTPKNLIQLESEGLSLVEMSKCYSSKPTPNYLSHLLRALKIKHYTKSEYIAKYYLNEATIKLKNSQLMDALDVSRDVIIKAREIYDKNKNNN